MKNKIQLTKEDLKKVIKEGVENFHKKTIIENRIREINEELSELSEYQEDKDSFVDYANVLSLSLAKEIGVDSSKVFDWFIQNRNKIAEFGEEAKKSFVEKDSMNENVMGEVEYEILESYLEAAIWTEEEEVGPASINDISDESREDANKDVLKFMSIAGALLNDIEPSQIGHDLWLTRNGHGAGFWDRGLGDVGDKLSDIARNMGEKSLYRGDDGKIHID